MIRKWDIQDKAFQKHCIDAIITRIDEIGDEKVGVIAAQDIIDIVTEKFGPEIYNKGLRDVKKLLTERLNDLNIEIDLLEQKS